MAKSRTHNGAVQYEHSLDHAVEFFSKAGSLMKSKKRKMYYGNSNETTALELFKAVWYSGQKEIAMKLLYWLRDIRGGSGNRSGFRDCIKWLAETDPMWLSLNISLIPEHGRWDDLRVLFGTSLEADVVKLWGDAIIDRNVLAAKWADRSDKPLLRYLRKSGIVGDIGEFRRLLASIRSEHIVETKMCSKNWLSIAFDKLPSVAMARYTKAFMRNASTTFEKFKEKLTKEEVKINASALFPHDCVRTMENGDIDIANAQFDALPNYMEGENGTQRIMVICDSSGSMVSTIAGSIQAIDVSTSLSLYCSDRIPKDSPFYRKFIQFESESKLSDWNGMKFSDAYGYGNNGRGKIFNGACGSTNIERALDSILAVAKNFNATNEQIPNVILIVSDMQFDSGVILSSSTVVESCLDEWEKAGYTRPKIIYWNVAGYAGSPATALQKDVGMVSGFSPAILKSIFGGEDFTPKGIMLRAIAKYKVVCPRE